MPRSLPDDPILIHAYLDGELNSVDAIEMKKRIAADPSLAAECERIEALRQLMRDRMLREAPSPELREADRIGNWDEGRRAAALVARPRGIDRSDRRGRQRLDLDGCSIGINRMRR